MHRTKPPRRHPSRQVAAICAICFTALAAAGCSYSGGIENPLIRKATWFSYLNGDDIRDRCESLPDRFEVRLVYNGKFTEQVRSYEIKSDGAGGARVTARAMPQDAGNLLKFRLSDPLATGRWEQSTVTLSPAEREQLVARLADSGVFRRAPSGIDLKSWGSYWVSIACRDGEVFFNAWKAGSERWDQQQLWQIVRPLDNTGVPFYEPHPARFADSPTITRSSGDRQAADIHFLMTTGDNGLIGLP
ncbi:hypothetical protein CKO28_07135 [Rhodovibrio sodomensis]|uniref:Lipoprotein n=1 Tax=Rhodovibrio sodomensis TaxID=1088 RepID=A0ABS1DCZ5_9PROT|nr:hypothetical protein [Rhodovibrio sodomensis]MBK1667807.1 hypothetical protein [Rhodovibrio sodomensis]